MRLLFIGDSLIENFDWQERFPKNVVYNMGVSGETVDGLYARIEVVYSQIEEADAVFIMSGINNIAMGDRTFVPVYRKVVRGLKEHYASSRIFVQSLLPVLFPWISNDEIREMNRQLKKMAEEEHVIYLDIHSLLLEEGEKTVKAYLMDDGVHVSEKGYSVWSGEIEKYL
ncbi:MAG: lipolytic protein family [Nitrospirae bacterium]|nr:lipolytic protein family [Nitrospirota bacterium]